MRWVEKGPDIPIEIVRAVQQGQVVFFCGAGVSQQAGLPGFDGLVNSVYQRLHRRRELYPLEQKAFEDGDYDQVLAHLERVLQNPGLVRKHVADVLHLPPNADTRTHDALIRLATDGSGTCRLVTTNYDVGFDRHKDSSTRLDAAPRLPVPKPGRWNSVVHLHGFLNDGGPNMEELILSSADFGAAYLVDGWATRFLRTLFQHYIVLFVGYRAEDLVVRYMLQALSIDLADRGERPRAFAFAEIDGDEKSTKLSWDAKGITPILYAKDGNSHGVLHETLRQWADRYSLRLLGRRNVILESVCLPTVAQPNETADRVVWALDDETGGTARFLADQEPSPEPGAWLTVLDQNKLLSLSDVPLVGNSRSVARSEVLHPVTWYLASWLSKHLSEPEVLDWVLAKTGYLHPKFSWLVTDAINRGACAASPDLKKIWAFLARPFTGPAPDWNPSAHEIDRQISSGAWDLHIQGQLAAMLEPSFKLSRDKFKDILRKSGRAESLNYPLEVDVTLAGGDDLDSVLGSIRQRADRALILTSLLSDCTNCLRRALETLEHLEQISPDWDVSSIWLESITPNATTRHHKQWIALVQLAAECLDAAVKTKPPLARAQVDYWKTIKYPVFRRLTCYALTSSDLFSKKEAASYVLDHGTAMWNYPFERDFCDLLTRLWPGLEDEPARDLISLLLQGPPRLQDREDLLREDVEWNSDCAIAERLSALEKSGGQLPENASEFLRIFRLKRERREAEPTQETIPVSSSEIPAFAAAIKDGLTSQLLLHQWGTTVSTDWQTGLAILRTLSENGYWPADVWNVTLAQATAWAINEPSLHGDVISLVKLADAGPNDFLAAMSHPLTQFLKFAPRAAVVDESNAYWSIWNKALITAAAKERDEGGSKVTLARAINTATGHLTEALFEWLRQRAAVGNHEIPQRFWDCLGIACSGAPAGTGRWSRSLTSMRLNWLFSKNQEWVRRVLLPSFDWGHPDEASAVWSGFLAQPSLSGDLWLHLRADFIATFGNINQLDPESATSIYQQFAWIVVHSPDWLDNEKCQRIVTTATHDGRHRIAWVLWRSLAAAEDRSGSLWRERIGPWLAASWQPDAALKHPDTSDTLVRMLLAAGDAFPEAVDVVETRLGPVKHVSGATFAIGQTNVPKEFPQATTKLLNLIIDRDMQFSKVDLANLLSQILQAWPEATQDKRFVDLRDFSAA